MGDRDHYLHGVEDVRSAANTMRSAADTMQSAASTIDDAVRRLIMADYDRTIQMDQWLTRFEAAVAKIPKSEMQLKDEMAARYRDGYTEKG